MFALQTNKNENADCSRGRHHQRMSLEVPICQRLPPLTPTRPTFARVATSCRRLAEPTLAAPVAAPAPTWASWAASISRHATASASVSLRPPSITQMAIRSSHASRWSSSSRVRSRTSVRSCRWCLNSYKVVSSGWHAVARVPDHCAEIPYARAHARTGARAYNRLARVPSRATACQMSTGRPHHGIIPSSALCASAMPSYQRRRPLPMRGCRTFSPGTAARRSRPKVCAVP